MRAELTNERKLELLNELINERKAEDDFAALHMYQMWRNELEAKCRAEKA